MDAVQANWLSILPPVLAIVLALVTKDCVFSLLLGALSGTIIYTVLAGLNPIVGPIEMLFTSMVDNMDLYILIFCCLLGAIVQVISLSGASAAYGQWGGKRLRTRRSTLLATSLLGGMIFIDDYFNCLTVGTVMTPLTDRQKVSRAKLAYIIDSTAAPVCIIAPISSWAAAVGSNLQKTGHFTSDFAAFCATIPYNLYALLTLVMVLTLSIKGWDFGPMAKQEARAKDGDLGAVQTAQTPKVEKTRNGRITDMVIPILLLIVFASLGMMYNGGFWAKDGGSYMSFTGALGNCSAGQALAWAGLADLIVISFMFVPRRLMNFREFMDCVSEGMKNMLPAGIILILAWTISGICRDQLQTAVFVRDVMAASSIPGALLPAIIFVVAAFLSFSTGTAWGTFAILIPIVVPVATALSPHLLIVALSATLAGSVFGDHSSPISDTTILSSTGAGCDHLLHVSTQIPYALCVAGASIVGYLVAGFTDGNLAFVWISSLATLALIIFVMHQMALKDKGNAKVKA